MKNFTKNIYIIILLTINFLIVNPVFAISFDSPDNFINDSFYQTPLTETNENKSQIDNAPYSNNVLYSDDIQDDNLNDPNHTIPPLKLLRLKLKAYQYTRDERKNKKGKIETNIEETPNKDEEQFYETNAYKNAKIKRDNKAKIQKETEISIKCKHMDYETSTGMLVAFGDVVTEFPNQETILKSDYLICDKIKNKIHAEGNVVIIRSGQETTGESIDIDLNEESIFMKKPVTINPSFKIFSEEGFVQQNIITQNKGSIEVKQGLPVSFQVNGYPDIRPYMKYIQKYSDNKNVYSDGENKIFKIEAKEIYLDGSNKNMDILKLKKGKITCNNKTILKFPRVTIYSNKGHDYAETSFIDLGSRRYLGMYLGPGVIVKLPGSAILKLIPAVSYRRGFGFGGVGKFYSATNQTMFGYSSAKDNQKIVIKGSQKLDDHLKIDYVSYDYIDNWFLGNRIPKYGVNLVYRNGYHTNKIFGNKYTTSYEHRISGGYFKDFPNGMDDYYDQIDGTNKSTLKFTYMNQLNQVLYNYKNINKDFRTDVSLTFEGSASLYGTGDTQIIAGFGPSWRLLYKNWMQEFNYRISGYNDETPMPVYDAYRYGKSTIHLREYLKVCKYLTIAWYGAAALGGETYNNKILHECAFLACIGPDDLKVNIGYDWIRENAFINFAIVMDTGGTKVNFDKLTVKNPEDFNKLRKQNEELYQAAHINTQNELINNNNNNGILTKAVVENIDGELDDI